MEKTRYDLTEVDYKLIISALRYMRRGLNLDIETVSAGEGETAFVLSARALVADASDLLDAIE